VSGAAVEAPQEAEVIGGIVARYNVTDAAIAELRSSYSGMTIAGVGDKDGYKAVHEAKIHVRDLLVRVEKTRKELKQESLDYGRKVDSAAKSITERLEPLRDELAAEEKRIDDQKSAILAKRQQEISDRVNARVAALTAVNGLALIRVENLPAMLEEDFQAFLAMATETFTKAEAERVSQAAELDRLRKADDEAKAKAAAALEEQRKAQDAKQAELDSQRIEQEKKAAELRAESARIEREKRDAETAKRHAEEIEKARREAAEDARLEIIRNEKQRELEAERARIAAEAEKAEADAAMSDKEKLSAYAEDLLAVEVPTLKGQKALKAMAIFRAEFGKLLRGLK
jgi:hypothetical protein